MTRRWLPYPILSVLLLLIWLLLNQSIAPGTILLGALLGAGAVELGREVIVTRAAAREGPPRPRRRVARVAD